MTMSAHVGLQNYNLFGGSPYPKLRTTISSYVANLEEKSYMMCPRAVARCLQIPMLSRTLGRARNVHLAPRLLLSSEDVMTALALDIGSL